MHVWPGEQQLLPHLREMSRQQPPPGSRLAVGQHSPVTASHEVPAPQQTCWPAGPQTLADGQHLLLRHVVPAGQHCVPQLCSAAQQTPPTQTWPPEQQTLPHCELTLQHAPKKHVWMLEQHWSPQTCPTGQHWPLPTHDWPSRQLHVAPLDDCSEMMRWPLVVVKIVCGVTGTLPPPPLKGGGAGAAGAKGLGGGGTLSRMHCEPKHMRGGRQQLLPQTRLAMQQPAAAEGKQQRPAAFCVVPAGQPIVYALRGWMGQALIDGIGNWLM